MPTIQPCHLILTNSSLHMGSTTHCFLLTVGKKKRLSQLWYVMKASVHMSRPEEENPLQTSMSCKDGGDLSWWQKVLKLMCVFCRSSAWRLSWHVDTHNITCSCVNTHTLCMNNGAQQGSLFLAGADQAATEQGKSLKVWFRILCVSVV